MTPVEFIVWDWNGTLLDDTSLCVDTINVLLSKRHLPVLTLEKYRDIFTFPVQDYYTIAGFDFSAETFEVVANEFINIYLRENVKCPLQKNVPEVLQFLESKKVKQFILSAMEQKALNDSVRHQRIDHFFKDTAGISDHYAHSKSQIASQLLSRNGIEARKTMLIGDTLHDFEVAEQMGCRCILFTGGHQSEKRLQVKNALLIANLEEIIHKPWHLL